MAILMTFGCGNLKTQEPAIVGKDQVYQAILHSVRLGDGVPLNVQLSVRWRIEDLAKFTKSFTTPGQYDTLILRPRQLELANNVSNTFENVDSVFTVHRHKFVENLKDYLIAHLGEDNITIKEIIISRVIFPATYTNGKEKLAMQEQELDRIRKQSTIDLEKSKAAVAQAEANGEVAMSRAEMDAKVQEINAKTEKSRRLSRLAKAETEKQVSKLRAESEAEKKVLLAKADLTKKRDLKNLEMQKIKEMNQLAVDKEQMEEEMHFANDMKMAKLCSENPVYASYMVNKELASKVQIAVLPSNQDAGVFKGFLNSGMQNATVNK